jgi:hypothetical protein
MDYRTISRKKQNKKQKDYVTMEYTEEQLEVLYTYTDKIEEITTMPHHEYVRASGEKVSKLLDEYHVLWFHDDPGQMHLIKK